MGRTTKKAKNAPRLRLHKATGKGRVILNGQHFYTRADHDTPEAHEEYLQLIRRWEEGGRNPLREVRTPAELSNPRTVADLVAAYLEDVDRCGLYRKNGQATSQRPMIEMALDELVSRQGGAPLHQFRREHLIRHRDHLRHAGRLTPQGTNRKINLIRQAFRWGTDRGFVPDANMASIQLLRPLPAPKRTRKEVVADEHLEAILAALPENVAAMVRIQRLTGMRPGEVCAMRWCDIDRDLDLPGAEGIWKYTVASHKTEHLGEEAYYLLNERVQRELERFPATPRAFIFRPRDNATGETRGRAADRYTKDTYRRTIQRACRRAGVPVIAPHQLRHTFITEVANDPELGLAAASEAANHRSQASTLGYVHRQRELAVRVARR